MNVWLAMATFALAAAMWLAMGVYLH